MQPPWCEGMAKIVRGVCLSGGAREVWAVLPLLHTGVSAAWQVLLNVEGGGQRGRGECNSGLIHLQRSTEAMRRS
jgi:hypothetical protein